MGKFRKVLAFVIAMTMVVGMSLAAFADDGQTINISNAVEGETYTAYKLMDAVYDGDPSVSSTPISYFYVGTASDSLYGILAEYFQFEAFQDGKAQLKVVDANGAAIDYSGVNAAGLAAAINSAMDAETLTLASAGSAKAAKSGETVVASISVPDKGYYFVNTSLGAVCSIDTTGRADIAEKNTTTTNDKKVQEDSTTNFGDKDDAQIGDTITFKSIVTIGKAQKNVVFHDVMQTDKLAFSPASVTVSAPNGKYTILTGDAADEGDTFTVKFDSNWTEGLTDATTEVVITYTATLTENAIIGSQSDLAMDEGNDNKSKVTYGDSQSTEWDWTRTYTWGFDILKYTGTEKTPLAGAKFNFKLGNTVLSFNQISAGNATSAAIYKYDATGEVTELVTPESGLITLQGLDADTYTLTETEAPAGYNKLLSDITVVLDSNTDSAQGDDNTHQKDASLTIKQDDATVNRIEVLNNTGSTLPSTGGMGTTIFYVIGGILVLAAAIILISKRRVQQ